MTTDEEFDLLSPDPDPPTDDPVADALRRLGRAISPGADGYEVSVDGAGVATVTRLDVDGDDGAGGIGRLVLATVRIPPELWEE